MVAQLFFCHLFYTLTKFKIITGVLLLLIAVHVAFSWTSAILLLVNPTTQTTGEISFTTTTIGAVSCAATDLIFAISLASKFWVMMKDTIPGQSTRSLMFRILLLTFASGAVCTLLMMILLLKSSPAHRCCPRAE
ncbi:hypothetical protein K438DRAFT_828073 [Mycena galopus ATCC 62051]|nr:hypothetical protein K438DRAFT_828073 [Mycena galopus ATCC 62051]